MSKNKITIIVSIICSIILLLGGTYAAWNFLTEKTSVTMLVGGDQISFDAGANITVDKILPVYTMEDGITKDITVYKAEGDYTAGIDLYLNLKTWPSTMSNPCFRWAVYKNGAYLSSGDFSGKSKGNTIRLTSYTQKLNLEEEKDTYTLYMWIDAYQETNVNMMNKSFSVNLYGQVSFYDNDDPIINEVEPNVPDLADGMIPIKYNYSINEWVKADESNKNNDWYDYYNKMWANAVMVTSDTREEYMDSPVGTTVSNDDILAYYVWIPRYKYVLFNVNSEIISPREIQIEFQKETDEIFEGTDNGQYLTHPAFWWDNNSNGQRETGEELAGIWVGKFTTSENSGVPKIIPNVIPATEGTISALYNRNKKFENINYLTESGVEAIDAHMMKNIEYGAVLYLSNSRYGINSEILKGSSNTGRYGDYTYNDFYISDSKTTSNKESGTGVKTSTTGNVYGIYDTSFKTTTVFSLMKASDGSIYYTGTGFNASTLPELKYFDLYEYGTSTTDYTRRKLGDATSETLRWYSNQTDDANLYSSTVMINRKYFYFRAYGSAVHNSGMTRNIVILP